MPAISRRSILGGVAAISTVRPTWAEMPDDFSVDADGGSVAVNRYAAHQAGKRGGILILHGSRGIELKPSAYRRYADALNATGLDVYLVRYFTNSDIQALDPEKSTRQRREAYETLRFDRWAMRVSSVATTVLTRPECSGRIGVLGFSLGGFVAAGTVARDERITALAVL